MLRSVRLSVRLSIRPMTPIDQQWCILMLWLLQNKPLIGSHDAEISNDFSTGCGLAAAFAPFELPLAECEHIVSFHPGDTLLCMGGSKGGSEGATSQRFDP